MEPVKIDEALEKDEDMQLGMAEFKKMDDKATAVAKEISEKLVESIVKEEQDFNVTTAILAASKVLTHLASFMYDTEDEFLVDVKKARTDVVSDIIPALLDPQPCGLCEECKNGHPEECINPTVRGDHTSSRFLPVLANMLIEYDLFNKVIHMYTVGKYQDEESKEE